MPTSCNNITIIEELSKEQIGIKTDSNILYKSDYEFLASLGYDTTKIVDNDSLYVIDSFWIAHKDYLQELKKKYPLNNSRASWKNTLPIDRQRINIQFQGESYETEGEEALKKAVKEWNNLQSYWTKEKSAINFTTSLEDKNNYRPTVTAYIKRNPSDPNSFLNMGLFVPGEVTNKFYINTAHEYWTKMSENMQKYTVMHMLGHLIGMDNDKDRWSGSIMVDELFLSDGLAIWSGFDPVKDIEDIIKKYPLKEQKEEVKCTPNVVEENKNFNLDINKEYTFTTSFDYVWCVMRYTKISTKTISGSSNCYTFKKLNDESFKIKFTDSGVCQVNITYIDKLDETEYTITRTLTAQYDKPEFEVPTHIELGQYYDFKIKLSSENKIPQYDMKVEEKYFGAESNVSIRKVGEGHYQIAFNDYGDYTVTARVTNLDVPERIFKFTHFYKPQFDLQRPLWNWNKVFSWQEWVNKNAEPTGSYSFKIDFLPEKTLPHNLVFDTQVTMLSNTFNLPERVDRSFDIETPQTHKLRKGDSSHFEIKRNSTHEQLDDKGDHYIDTYPYDCTITYPETEVCGILK